MIAQLFHLAAAIARYREAELDKVLDVHALSAARYRALSVIAGLQPCTMNVLAIGSVVDRTTLTRTIDQLVAQGLVDRQTTAADRRQVVLCLTDTGQAAYRGALDAVEQINLRIVNGIPQEDLQAFVQIERQMLANLRPDPSATVRPLEPHHADEPRNG